MSNACKKLRLAGLLLAALFVATGADVESTLSGGASEDAQSKTADGLTVYFGVMPAAIVKGLAAHTSEPPMHGGAASGTHEYHMVVAVFDAATNARISDATVTAKVSGLGLSGPEQTLKAMKIADTVTYGTFFDLPPDLYTISLMVQRPKSQPVAVNFTYDHRNQ
jgi:hypothetical protein